MMVGFVILFFFLLLTHSYFSCRYYGRHDCQVSQVVVHYNYHCSECYFSSHLSPFVFALSLLPLLKKTAQEPNSDVRVVIVGSTYLCTHTLLYSHSKYVLLDRF